MMLNPGSRVRTDTDSVTSVLSVDGDVLFSLSADSPVTLGTGMLRLKGARAVFRVQAHRQSPGQSVEVLRGTLTAEKAYPSDFPDTETLHAGTMVMINRDIDLMEKETFDTASLSLRMKGTLRFSDIPLAALVKKLEDWYGVEIRLDGETGDRFSGNFENARIRSVLDALSAGRRFSYTIDGYHVALDLR
jgi:ferric-dicitrate binding protein FerR (iron transport regulator)